MLLTTCFDPLLTADQATSLVRAAPTNGTLAGAVTGSSSTTVSLPSCPTLLSAASASPLASGLVGPSPPRNGTLRPIVKLTVNPASPATVHKWAVQAKATPAVVPVPEGGAGSSNQQVVFTRRQAAAGGPGSILVSGTVNVENPQLMQRLTLLRVGVECTRPGVAPGTLYAAARCPRDASGMIMVDSAMSGAGIIRCPWSMVLNSTYAGTGSTLTGVVLSADGQEVVSSSTGYKYDASKPASVGRCAILSGQPVSMGLGGVPLIRPAGTKGVGALPGAGSTLAKSDIICSTRTVVYGLRFPWTTSSSSSSGGSGSSCVLGNASALALALPTTGPTAVAAGRSDLSLTTNGCLMPVGVSAVILGTQMLEITPTVWTATATLSPSRLSVNYRSSVDLGVTLRYRPLTATSRQRAIAGRLVIRATGFFLALQQVEVLVQDSTSLGPSASFTLKCPGADVAGVVNELPDSGLLTCPFQVNLPASTGPRGTLTARVATNDGGQTMSAPMAFDFSDRSKVKAMPVGNCAMVQDLFLMGNRLMQPSSSSRPDSLAAPEEVCAPNPKTVGYSVTFGPYTKAQCGTYTVSVVGDSSGPWPASKVHVNDDGARHA